jgi:hypothetical protein
VYQIQLQPKEPSTTQDKPLKSAMSTLSGAPQPSALAVARAGTLGNTLANSSVASLGPRLPDRVPPQPGNAHTPTGGSAVLIGSALDVSQEVSQAQLRSVSRLQSGQTAVSVVASRQATLPRVDASPKKSAGRPGEDARPPVTSQLLAAREISMRIKGLQLVSDCLRMHLLCAYNIYIHTYIHT